MTAREMDKKDIETSAANTIRNILTEIGSYVYGTKARTYEQTPVKTLDDIRSFIDEFDGLYRERWNELHRKPLYREKNDAQGISLIKSKIIIEKIEDGQYRSWLDNCAAKWEAGHSKEEAIGKMIISYFPELIKKSKPLSPEQAFAEKVLKPVEKELDEKSLRQGIEDYAKKNSLSINEKVYKNVVKMNGMCPCRTDNTPCPCKYADDDIKKKGRCHCGLYKKEK